MVNGEPTTLLTISSTLNPSRPFAAVHADIVPGSPKPAPPVCGFLLLAITPVSPIMVQYQSWDG